MRLTPPRVKFILENSSVTPLPRKIPLVENLSLHVENCPEKFPYISQ